MQTNALEQNPELWGPHVWATLHVLALRSDSTLGQHELDAFHQLLKSLEALLPCSLCKTHYKSYAATHDQPKLGQAFLWTVNLHNEVNKRLGKPTVTYEEARKTWISETCTFTCTEQKKEKKYFLETHELVIGLFGLILLGLLVQKIFRHGSV